MKRSIKSCIRPSFAGAMALALLCISESAWAEQTRWTLAMNNAELRDVVIEMSEILGKTVILDSRVQGRITVASKASLDREGVRRLFYSVLDANNFTVIDEGERILVTPVADAKTRAGNGDVATAEAAEFVTQVIELGSSSAADLAGLVRPLVSTHGYVGPSVSANALVITETASNVRRIAQVVRQLDSGSRNSHSLVELRHGLASDIAKVMEPSLGKQTADSATQVIVDVANNRLVLIGPAAVRQRLTALARTLDTPTSDRGDNARVIRLRHSDAKQLAGVLDAMGQGLGAGVVSTARGKEQPTGANASTLVRADESQNALVIMADPAQLRTLENIIAQLDQPRSQVLIHAAIVEVSGDISQALGVQWGGKGGSAQGAITFPGAGAVLGVFGSDTPLPEGALVSLGTDRFSALISALASDVHNNVLSTPSLLTLDNQQAEILVGQNVPFKSGSYTTSGTGSDNPFTTVTRQDIGISLKIKPYINEGSTLRLEVEQENSEIAPTVSGVDSSDLITNKRSLKSTILADDGEIIVIGGLIKDSVRTQQSGVPLLRSIPYLGALFRWSRDTHQKTNLMVFLRPTIVRSKRDLESASADRYNALRDLSKSASKDANSLLLPRNPHQMFDPTPASAAPAKRP